MDRNLLDLLKSDEWQVIYGRRGSGKTLLLGAMAEAMNEQFLDSRRMAISINMPDCIVSPIGREVTDAERALGYFQEFMRRVAEELFQRISDAIGRPTFADRLTRRRAGKVGRIETLSLELLQLAEDGGRLAAFDVTHRTSKDERKDQLTKAGGASVDISLSSTEFAPSVDLSGKIRHATERERVGIIITEGGPTLRLAAVGRKIGEILREMDIDRLAIVIDEWQTMDPSGSTAIQPRFAELLKRTLFDIKAVTIKVATNRYQTAFSNRAESVRHRGLEMNAELFEAANLDYGFFDEDDLCRFYESLLFKRLRFVEPQMEQFGHVDHDGPRDEFLNSMFRNERAFTSLVRGAQGVPRDFLVLFNEVAQRNEYSVGLTWDSPMIEEVIRDLAVTGRIHNALTFQSEADQILNKTIRAVCLRTCDRVVIASAESLERFGAAFDELLEKRFLHDVPRTRMPAVLPNKCRAYLVDYGTWLEWQRSAGSEQPDESADTLTSLRGELGFLVLDTSIVQVENLVRCTNCQQWFPRDAKVFVRRKICPHCCEDVLPPT